MMPEQTPSAIKTCTIVMRFDEQSVPRALELLMSACGPIRAKRGCKMCRIERDAADSCLLRYVEEWDSEDAFRRHLRSEEFWRVLVTMDLSSEEPEVAIGDLSVRYGMEVLRNLREG